MYSTPYESPAEFQWDADSAPCQSTNCGPASVEKVATFMADRSIGIQATRLLARSTCGGTNLGEQKLMLEKRGIKVGAYQWSPAQIRTALSTGRRPLVLWLVMESVPAVIRGHAFLGRHAVAALGLARGRCPVHAAEEDGIWIMDPNFHRDRTLHPERIFYPDHVWAAASAAIGRWVIVPNSDKYIPPPPAPVAAPTYSANVTVANTHLWNPQTSKWVYSLAVGTVLYVRGARYTRGGVSCYPTEGPEGFAGYFVPASNVRLTGTATVPVTVTRTALTVVVEVTAVDGVNVRSEPRTDATRVGFLTKGTRKTTRQLETAGGAYKYGAITRRDWVSVYVNGQWGWIARAWTRNV